MSWIKDHTFAIALGGVTLAVAGGLFVVGSKGASEYGQAKSEFDAAVEEARSFESLALYPQAENRDGKHKALDDYRKALDSLQQAFEKFRPSEIKNISPQDFTNHLIEVNDEVREAFGKAGAQLPNAFFCGFEGYRDALARGNATGMLDYQLSGMRAVLLALASAGPGELKNLHRPSLGEEDGTEFKPLEAQVARALPMEITFRANEKSLRAFITALSKLDKHYAVIRSIRIVNAKKDLPRTSDAKFEPVAAQVAPAPNADQSTDESWLGTETTTASNTGTRILSQVLGREEVLVFLRIDLMQFLPAAKLP
jgi:hypothetical protein